jgi:hypothetical protein
METREIERTFQHRRNGQNGVYCQTYLLHPTNGPVSMRLLAIDITVVLYLLAPGATPYSMLVQDTVLSNRDGKGA